MTIPRVPPSRSGARQTLRLQEIALDARDRVYRVQGTGDWLWLLLLSAVLLGNGLYVWCSRGLGDTTGRAIFFGLLVLTLYWATLVYIFKLSVTVRVGVYGIALARGPWSTQLAWAEVGRLTERVQAAHGRRYRWVVVLARDGRELRVREDMVTDYTRLRLEVYERYRLWRDSGGTSELSGAGPLSMTESVAADLTWWGVSFGALLLPAIYMLVLFPQLAVVGSVCLLLALAAGAMLLRGFLRSTTYVLDAKALEVRQPFRQPRRLQWRDVARVERSQHRFNGAIRLAVSVGRVALTLAARTDGRLASFTWTPRIPEYLTLRGGGRSIRISLHRLARPDDLLAWVEFYERVGRRAAAQSVPEAQSSPSSASLEQPLAPTSSAAKSAVAVPSAGSAPKQVAGASVPLPVRSEESPNAASAPGWEAHPAAEASLPASSDPSGMPVGVSENEASTTSTPAAHEVAAVGRQADSGIWQNTVAPTPVYPSITPPASPAATPPVRPAPDAPPSGADCQMEENSWQQAFEPEAMDELSALELIDENTPTDSVVSLSDSFAPWREASWTRPPLPRFGPSPTENGEL